MTHAHPAAVAAAASFAFTVAALSDPVAHPGVTQVTEAGR